MPDEMKAAPEAGDSGAGLATALVGRVGGEGAVARWGQRLASAHLAYLTARQLEQHYRNWRNQQRYSVALYDGDVLYTPVQAWVLAHMPAEAQRAVLVRSDRRDTDQGFDPEPRGGRHEPEPLVHLYFDGDRVQKVMLDGHEITVGAHRTTIAPGPSWDAGHRRRHVRAGERSHQQRGPGQLLLLRPASTDGAEAAPWPG